MIKTVAYRVAKPISVVGLMGLESLGVSMREALRQHRRGSMQHCARERAESRREGTHHQSVGDRRVERT